MENKIGIKKHLELHKNNVRHKFFKINESRISFGKSGTHNGEYNSFTISIQTDKNDFYISFDKEQAEKLSKLWDLNK